MTQPIRTAVIPAAGLGTRTLPASKAIPKEMLPIVDRPAIQRVVEEAVDAGVEHVILVVSAGKEAIGAHFSPSPAIEQRLRETGQLHRLACVDRLMRTARFTIVDQHAQLGLGHAVLQARAAVGEEPFLCLLGDCVFRGDPGPSGELVTAHERHGGSIIGLQRVPRERLSRYGVAGGTMVDQRTLRIDRLVEKPRPEEAPGDLAVAARYVLSPAIFDCLLATHRGAGGEIQLTDAIARLLAIEPVHGVLLSATRHDVGNLDDWLAANLAFAGIEAGTGDRKGAKPQRPEQR